MSAPTLWNQLREAGVVTGDCPTDDVIPSPWYVRAMLGAAGWIAALLLLSFIGLAFALVMRSPSAMLLTGLLTLIGAYAVFVGAKTNDFATQFGIAVSFTGQALVIGGIVQLFDHQMQSSTWFLIALVEAALAILLPNFVHRVWSAYAGAVAFSVAVALSHGSVISASVLTTGVAVIWLNEFSWPSFGSMIRAIGYGLTLALVQEEGVVLSGYSMPHLLGTADATTPWLHPWIGEVLLAGIFVFVVWRLLARAREPVPQRLMVASLLAAVAIGVVSYEARGVTTGLLIIVLGYAHGNRTLTGIGMVALVLYVSGYYYLLESTLLVKAQVLGLTGGVLLAVRWAVIHWLWPEGVQPHA